VFIPSRHFFVLTYDTNNDDITKNGYGLTAGILSLAEPRYFFTFLHI